MIRKSFLLHCDILNLKLNRISKSRKSKKIKNKKKLFENLQDKTI